MGVFSNKIDRAELKLGDHIYSWRTAYLYSHHGIYMGDGKVIHFTRAAGQEVVTGTVLDRVIASSPPSHPTDSPCPVCGDQSRLGGVIRTCIDCFLSGGDLYIFEYGVSPISYIANTREGTCALAPSDPSEEVIHRTTFLLENGFGAYSVFKNNCEDFAMYCKTGLLAVGRSGMGLSGQVASLAAAASAIVPLPLGYFVASYVGRTAVGLGMYCIRRWVSNMGVERVSVETLVASSGFIIGPEQKDQIDFSNNVCDATRTI